MNTITDLSTGASACAPSIFALPAVPQTAPHAIHVMASTYVFSTPGNTAFGSPIVVAGARVRDAKQAAPPRGERH